jgi:hypothetical protein
MATTNGEVVCRKYPDTITHDVSKLPIYRDPTRLEISCWTASSMGSAGSNVGGTWLKTNQGCYVNADEMQERKDYQTMLNHCATPNHWVGIMLPQYAREDCYDCPSLDCPSRDLGQPPYVDIGCKTDGEEIRGTR